MTEDISIGPRPERFSASVAGRHMACHASANLHLAIPGWVPPIRDDMAGAKGVGTTYHQYFANIMELPAKDIACFAEAIKYIADLRSTRRFKVLVEQTVTATWLSTQPKTTPDLVLYTQDEIHVVDLKTGKIEVDAWENEQLMYAAVTLAHLAPKAKGVTMHIVQPWAKGGNSVWFADTTRIKQFMDDALAAEAAIASGSTKFGPSDHCKFCPANPHTRGDKGRPLCPAMMQVLYPQVVDEDELLNL